MKIIDTNNDKYTFEVDSIVKVEETYTLDELNSRKTKFEEKKLRAEEIVDTCDAELEKINSLINLING